MPGCACPYNRFLGGPACGGTCTDTPTSTVLNNCDVTIGHLNIANVEHQSVVNNNGSQWMENESSLYYNNENKNVLIGTDQSSGDYDLEVDGKVRFMDTLKVQDVCCVSDKRLKDEIMPIDRATERLKRIRGVGFRWKKNGKHTHGVIAQEVEAALPGATVADPETGSLAVNYNALIGLLIEAVKNQSQKIEQLQQLSSHD